MFPWILFWAPQLYFPWSGSVIQDIDPETTWFPATLTARAGNGRIEKRALNDVASYGRQLGLITEVLIEIAGKQPLTARTATSLARLKDIRSRIEAIKEEEAVSTAEELAQRIRWLQEHDAAQLVKLRNLLARRDA